MSTRLSHPLYRLILFFVHTLAVSLPTTALAAPASQGGGTAEIEAVLLAYYESDVVPIEDADGVIVGLSFYDDDTFELELDFLDGEDASLAYGDYAETDDGILLTVLSADGEELAESVEVELVYDADDTLIVLGSPDGIIGEEDIILYPTDLESDE